MLFGHTSIVIHNQEYKKCTEVTLRQITENNSDNFYEEKNIQCDKVTYSRGILLLGSEIYKKVSFITKFLGIKKKLISYYTIVRQLYKENSLFFNIFTDFHKEIKQKLGI